MSDTQDEQTKVLNDFTAKIEEFMGHVVEMNKRLNELEIAVAYLLNKDPEWVADFQKRQKQEKESTQNEGQTEERRETLIEPE